MLTELKTEMSNAERMELWTAGARLLEERRAIAVEEFESILMAQFANCLPQGNLAGKKRSRAENEIDWVKANLTRQHQIEYFTANGVRLILWLPQRGSYAGEPLMNRNDALLAFRAIITKTV